MTHKMKRDVWILMLAVASAAIGGAVGGRAWLFGAAAGLIAFGLGHRASRRSSRSPAEPSRPTVNPVPNTASGADAGRYRAMLDALPDAAMLLDERGGVALANAHALRVLSLGPLEGRHAGEVFTRADLARAHEPGPPRRWVARMRLADEERWIEATLGRVEPFTLLTLRDVHDGEEASRVRTEFVANASHELRTPIAAIRAAIETLQSDAASDANTVSRLHAMVAGQVERLESLVRDLLDLASVERPDVPIRPMPLRLPDLEQSLREEFAGSCAERRLTLRFDWADGGSSITTDPRLLALALRNLIENAVRFAYEGTEILVAGTRSTDRWRIEVRDRGAGIPVAHQARVFERFYQVDPARAGGGARGSGLGLAIVRHAVRAMGGSVGLTSVWKEGTTVWIEAPLRAAPSTSTDHWGVPAPRV